MRFLALGLLIFAAVSNCRRIQMNGPVDETDSQLRGVEPRANRTSDIIIVNNSTVPFKLKTLRCAEGVISPGLEPDDSLPLDSGTVFGIESSRYQKGVKCGIMYEGEDGRSWCSMTISNPFYGDAGVEAVSSPNLYILSIPSIGHNNKVGFVVKDQPGRQLARRFSRRKFKSLVSSFRFGNTRRMLTDLK